MRGHLIIPEGVEIKWGEPAILGQICRGTPLFITPPTRAKSDYNIKALVQQAKEIQAQANQPSAVKEKSFFSSLPFFKKATPPSVKFTNPKQVTPFKEKGSGETRRAVLCRLRDGIEGNHALVHPDCLVLEPGTQVFVRQYREIDDGYSDNVYEVSLVAEPKEKNKEVRSDMPELNRDMQSTGVHGYIFCEDVVDPNHVREFTVKMEGDIFEETSQIEDVQQSVLGDCFFLAAVAAILKKPEGYAYFQSIIKQEDENTSVVKLYNFKEKKFVYIRVQNTIFCENDETTLRHRQKWIHILEKAYVGMGVVKLDRANMKETFPSYREVYGSGGEITDALRALTGAEPEEIFINMAMRSQSERITSDMTDALYKRVAVSKGRDWDWSSIETELYRLNGGCLHSHKLGKEQLDHNVYSERVAKAQTKQLIACFGTIENLRVFSEFLQMLKTSDKAEDQKKYSEISLAMTEIDNRRDAGTMTEILHIFNLCMLAGLEDSVVEKIFEFPKKRMEDGSYPYVGPLGSGMYTKYHLWIYEQIEKSVNEGKLISVGTNDTAAGAKGMVGLRTPHAYTIMGVEKKEDTGVTLYYVKVRNTWGYMGREYYADKDHQMLAREKEYRGNFRLELGDFVNAMYNIASCEMPALQLACQEEAEQTMRRRPF